MAYNKVVISGINTSSITVLKEDEKIALLKEYKKTGSKVAKDKLINGNLRLVLSVIQKFVGRGEEVDDLFQISGELRRHLRDYNHIKVSRSMRDLAYKSIQAKELLTTTLQREPTIEEVCKEVGAEKYEVVTALESICEPVSLYEPVFSDSGDTLYVIDQIGDNQSANEWIDDIAIKEAVNTLSSREKKILNLRFYRGKTQIEVANEIGISQAQVSRLEKNAINRIKSAI